MIHAKPKDIIKHSVWQQDGTTLSWRKDNIYFGKYTSLFNIASIFSIPIILTRTLSFQFLIAINGRTSEFFSNKKQKISEFFKYAFKKIERM